MMSQPNPYATPSQLGVRPSRALSVGLLSQSFAWMFVGLLVTAVVAWFVQGSQSIQLTAARLYLPVILVQFALVIGISAGIRRLNATAALGLFLVYSALMGVTVSFIVAAYPIGSVAGAFISAAGMFGAAALYGAVTKRSLATIGGYAFMGLIGIVIASLVNAFLIKSDSIGYLVSIVGVVIFVALTAWHVQKISRGDLAAATGSLEKGAVFGALLLYLDFVNIFLLLLRVFGGNRR
jgi:FtsH-binding integral membrane protein